MAYPLARLLSLRDFREETARKTQETAEASARAAAETLAAREKELADYRVWRREEAERRYRVILGQTLSQKELEEFKAGLALLEERELSAAEEARRAAEALEEARRQVQAARAAWRAADQARRKMLAHRDDWRAAQAREEVRREDLELEEFKPVRPAAFAEDEA